MTTTAPTPYITTLGNDISVVTLPRNSSLLGGESMFDANATTSGRTRPRRKSNSTQDDGDFFGEKILVIKDDSNVTDTLTDTTTNNSTGSMTASLLNSSVVKLVQGLFGG
jgi:hypothetical protein